MSAQAVELSVRPLRRAEYDQLIELGAFEDEPIELLDGVLVEMSPEGGDHGWFIQELNRAIARGLPDELRVRVNSGWIANDVSQPQPDLAIVRLDEYAPRQHPETAVLLIEVAFSSRAKDLGLKARLYGSAGVPVYWVIDLRDEVVHVHTEPTASGYERVERVGFDVPLDAAGVEVHPADLAPPR